MSFQTVEQLQATVAEQAAQYSALCTQVEGLTAEVERLRGVLATIGNAVIPAFLEGRGSTYADQVHRHHTSLRAFARAALQPKEGEG